MQLEQARRCVEEMIDVGVPLRDIEQYVRLIDVPKQGKARLLYRARRAARTGALSDSAFEAGTVRLVAGR
jgi:hypothetical protein